MNAMEKTLLSPERAPARTEKDRIQDEIALLPEIALTEKLDSSDLKELRRYFYPMEEDHGRLCHDMGFQKDFGLGIPLTKEYFAEAVFNVIGNKEYEIAARKLFDKLAEEGQLLDGCIWWDDFLEVIIRGSTEAQLIGAPPSKRIKGKRNALICPCKSPVVRVLLMETPHSACYAVVSKLGIVGIYDEIFELKVKYSVPMGRYKTANSSWVTDAVYAAEANGVIVASSARNFYVYNTSQIVHKLLFIILGIDNVPTCLHYCPLANREAELTIGDDKGDITSIHFHQPHKSFFQPQAEKKAASYFWLVKTQKQWVAIVTEKKVHLGEVNMVEYFPENKSIVSCSNDANASLVVRHKNGKQSSYITKLEKVMKVWDLESHSCVQTFHLNFPCGRIMELCRNLYPGIRPVASSEESCQRDHSKVVKTQTTWDKTATDDDVFPIPIRKDNWMRSEVVVVMGKYLKVLELENIYGHNVDPFPLPRRKLEPAIPTPYYPLTHTFRENIKALKQKMFKNLAGLAPFHDTITLSSFDLKHECEDEVEVLRMLIRNGAPHLAVKLSKRRPLPHSFFKIQEI